MDDESDFSALTTLTLEQTEILTQERLPSDSIHGISLVDGPLDAEEDLCFFTVEPSEYPGNHVQLQFKTENNQVTLTISAQYRQDVDDIVSALTKEVLPDSSWRYIPATNPE